MSLESVSSFDRQGEQSKNAISAWVRQQSTEVETHRFRKTFILARYRSTLSPLVRITSPSVLDYGSDSHNRSTARIPKLERLTELRMSP